MFGICKEAFDASPISCRYQHEADARRREELSIYAENLCTMAPTVFGLPNLYGTPLGGAALHDESIVEAMELPAEVLNEDTAKLCASALQGNI